MTLRQVEVIRAVMVTGTIGGAAKLLNVSAPGISRLVKYTERSLGVRFFQRQNGRYFPTPEAQNIFEQINGVYKKVDDLTEIISKIGQGALSELRIGSVPSISQIMVPRAVERVRRRYPDLRIDINVLKIEEAIDFLLLGRGDCVAMSYRLDHSGLDFLPLASGELFCIVPLGHPLAGRKQISAAELRVGKGGTGYRRHGPIHCCPWRLSRPRTNTNHRTHQIRNLHCGEARYAAVALHRTFHPLSAAGNAGRRTRSKWVAEVCRTRFQEITGCYLFRTSG